MTRFLAVVVLAGAIGCGASEPSDCCDADAAPVMDDTFSCLDELAGPAVVVSSRTDRQYANRQLPEGARRDARGSTFRYQYTDSGAPAVTYPVDLRGSGSWCWAGGAIVSYNDVRLTWLQTYSSNSAAIYAQGRGTFDGVRIHNAHDAIRPARNTDKPWVIKDVWVSYNRDDCIENDHMASGLVDDSLFDGCYVFLSSRLRSGVANDNTVAIQGSLIRMQEMPGPHGHGGNVMGHGALFKFQNDSPHLILKDNIFLIEQCASTPEEARNCARTDLIGFFPDTKLDECAGNIIVWQGPGEFPGDIPDDPGCVTVTTDLSVWEQSRAAWLANHPGVMRIEEVD